MIVIASTTRLLRTFYTDEDVLATRRENDGRVEWAGTFHATRDILVLVGRH